MITQQPYAKVLQGTVVVLNAFCFFPFKSWADGRIRRLAVSEALARDSRTSFLSSAWLEAVLGVWSDFDMHKIVPSLRWLRLSGSTVLFFVCSCHYLNDGRVYNLCIVENLSPFPVDSCERLGCLCWHSSASVLWQQQEVNKITWHQKRQQGRK